jgi:hypothetical protein
MSDISGRSVEAIAGELYALPPASFTAARDAAAADARGAGDREAAKRLAALKRPTQGAYLVNLLALRRPEVVAELITLGEQIRAAQGRVPAAQLRDLTNHRRSAIGAALRACRSLSVEAGSGEPTAQQVSEAEATLAAAMADEGAAAQVRAGQVTKAISYAGFGAGFGATAPLRAPGGAAVRPAEPAPPSASKPTPEPASTVDTSARRIQERAAWQRLAKAEAALATAAEQERATNEELDRIADEISRLRSALEEASRRARTARAARQAAERELASARRDTQSTEDGGG